MGAANCSNSKLIGNERKLLVFFLIAWMKSNHWHFIHLLSLQFSVPSWSTVKSKLIQFTFSSSQGNQTERSSLNRVVQVKNCWWKSQALLKIKLKTNRCHTFTEGKQFPER